MSHEEVKWLLNHYFLNRRDTTPQNNYHLGGYPGVTYCRHRLWSPHPPHQFQLWSPTDYGTIPWEMLHLIAACPSGMRHGIQPISSCRPCPWSTGVHSLQWLNLKIRWLHFQNKMFHSKQWPLWHTWTGYLGFEATHAMCWMTPNPPTGWDRLRSGAHYQVLSGKLHLMRKTIVLNQVKNISNAWVFQLHCDKRVLAGIFRVLGRFAF